MSIAENAPLITVRSRKRQTEILEVLLAKGAFNEPSRLIKMPKGLGWFQFGIACLMVAFILGDAVVTGKWGITFILVIYLPMIIMMFVKGWGLIVLGDGVLTANRDGLRWVQGGSEQWQLAWDRLEVVRVSKANFWMGATSVISIRTATRTLTIPISRDTSVGWAQLFFQLVLARPEATKSSPFVGLFSSLQLGLGLVGAGVLGWLVHRAAPRMMEANNSGPMAMVAVGMIGGFGAVWLVANAFANIVAERVITKREEEKAATGSPPDFSANRYADWILKAKSTFCLKSGVEYGVPSEVLERQFSQKYTAAEVHMLAFSPVLLLATPILTGTLVPVIPASIVFVLAPVFLILGFMLVTSTIADKKTSRAQLESKYLLKGDVLQVTEPTGVKKSYPVNLNRIRWVGYFHATFIAGKSAKSFPFGLLEPKV